MKKIVYIITAFTLVTLLFTGCQTSHKVDSESEIEPESVVIPKTYNDTFNQDEWENDVTVSVNYADFTVGTWTFRKVGEDSAGNKKYTIGEFIILHDIIGYNNHTEDLQYTKIADFENGGKNYTERTEDDLIFMNSSSVKLYLLNRSSRGPLNTSKDEWSKSTVLHANKEKTKITSYSEEWAKNSGTNTFAIYKTTYYFEKKANE